MNIHLDNLKVVFGVNEVGAAHFLLNNFLNNYKFKDYIIFAEKRSHDFLRNSNIKFKDAALEEIAFKNIIKKFEPNFIITGASLGFNIEKKLIKLANKNKIKSFSFIDANVNLWQRFVKDDPLEKWSIMPSEIIVDDINIKKRLIKLDCPLKIIKIKKEENINNIFFFNRTRIEKDFLIDFKYIFVIHETGITKSNRWDWDNNDQTVNDHMEVLIKTLIDKINIEKKNNQDLKLIIKAHPSDEIFLLKEKLLESNFKDFIIINDFDSFNYIKRALMIIGIGSKLLFNSALVNSNTYSLKLNKKGYYPFTENYQNINIIRSKDELNLVLDKYLKKI